METEPVPAPDPGVSASDKTNGMLCHLLAFSTLLVPAGNILGPLIIWLIKKQESEYVDYHGKESLNFQISMTIYFIIAAFLIIIFIGIILLFVLGIAWLVLVIIGTLKANEGIRYRYPFTIRFIK